MKTTIYTYTTEDAAGTHTYAFGTEEERNKEALKWLNETCKGYGYNLPELGDDLVDAYEVFQQEVRGSQDYLWWEDHEVELAPAPVVIYLEVSGGTLEWSLENPDDIPTIVREKDWDNIKAGDPDEWFVHASGLDLATALEMEKDTTTFIVAGSAGRLKVNRETGRIVHYDEAGEHEAGEGYDNIEKFDVASCTRPESIETFGEVDILSIGYWYSDGTYENAMRPTVDADGNFDGWEEVTKEVA